MQWNLSNDPVPLDIDEHGVARVGNTRVTLESVIRVFLLGATAEEITYRYPTLNLADVYAVLSYYLRRREDIDAYLAQEQQEAEDIRRSYEQRFHSNGLRDRLLARKVRNKESVTVEISG